MANPKAGTGKRKDPFEKERDIDFMLRLRLQKVPAHQILEKLNAMREREALAAFLAQGMPEDQARELAAEAKLSAQTVRTDFRQVLARLRAENSQKGEALVIERLNELQLDYQTLLMAEQRAWAELERSAGEATSIVTRQDAVEVPTGKTDGEGRALVERKMRPRDGAKRTDVPRAADPRWMERIESILWKRYQLGIEIFRLKSLLGMETPWEMIRAAGAGNEQAADQLRAHEVGLLYSMEARAAGESASSFKARFEMVSTYLQRKGGGEGGGITKRVEFVVRGLEVEQEGE